MCQLIEVTWFISKLSADQLILLLDREQCSMSYFTDNAHILDINVLINWQLSKQGTRWPVSLDRIAGPGVDPSRLSIFLKLSADKLLVFKWWQAQVQCFFKFIWNMLCLRAAQLKFWLQTDLGRENSAGCYRQGLWETVGFDFSHHDHALVTLYVPFVCSDWSKFDSWVEFMQHVKTCLLWQLKLTEFCVNLWCF